MPDRNAIIKHLKARVEFEKNDENYSYSPELRADIFAFLETCKNHRRGCEMIGFSRHTLRNWLAAKKKDKDENKKSPAIRS